MGETIVYAIKVALAIAAGVAFVAVIVTLIGLISGWTIPGVFGQVIGLISVYLPFAPNVVFSYFIGIIGGVLLFLAGKKAYEVLTTVYKSS